MPRVLKGGLLALMLFMTGEGALAQSPAEPATVEPVTGPVPSEVLSETPPEAPLVGRPPAAGDALEGTPAEAPVMGEALPLGADPAMEEGTGPLPHELTPLGMFLAADWVVKGVLLGLLAASALTWTVGLVKAWELWSGGRRARRMAQSLDRAATLSEALLLARGSEAPEAELVHEAVAESQLSQGRTMGATKGLVERVSSRLSRVEAALVRRMNRGTGILAIIGSTAPFIGLFGTVWGIMNAFIGISKSQTTNLAVVAPGIAEALLATAIGLVAAIPAVVLYNLFARAIGGYRARLSDLGADVERKVGRDAEFGRLPVGYADVAE